jgi:hypothetical protein
MLRGAAFIIMGMVSVVTGGGRMHGDATREPYGDLALNTWPGDKPVGGSVIAAVRG